MYKTAQQLPTEKLEYPITEAQEIGWDTAPLVCVIDVHSRVSLKGPSDIVQLIEVPRVENHLTVTNILYVVLEYITYASKKFTS